MEEKLKQILLKYWGYSDFRPGQLAIIKSIIKQQSNLAILTTGGGKSICYQVAGLYLGGLTIVISPLLSLMQDQVERLQQLGVRAAMYNSTISATDKYLLLEAIGRGELSFLYLAPEALAVKQLLTLLHNCPVSLVAVDEAHCVSLWGHDFRPAYLQIKPVIASFRQRVKIAAFTATATPLVRRDIALQLGFTDYSLHLNSFRRDNLAIKVARAWQSQQFKQFFQKRLEQSAILIYCSSRRRCEELAAFYLQVGFNTSYYHAGLPSEQRAKIQTDFLQDKYELMFATNAFGMGVDKPNLYTVVHEQIPDSLENYYQEAGRAGRDGGASLSLINAHWQGFNLRQQMLENHYLNVKLANRIYNHLLQISSPTQQTIKLNLANFLEDIEGINYPRLERFLLLAERAGILKARLDGNKLELRRLQRNILWLGLALPLKQEQQLLKLGSSRLKAVVKLVEGEHCRLQFVMKYFGENMPNCGQCDYCCSLD